MKNKRLKLRGWVKVVLVILFYIILLLSILDTFNEYSDLAKECDNVKGYTCSYYDMRQYSNRK